MTLEHRMKSMDAVPETDTLTPLEGGKHCPPFKARLFELADAELACSKSSAAELTPQQRALKAHIEHCPACATIYQSGLYFGSTPELSDSEGAMAQLATSWQQSDLKKLQGGASKKPYVKGTLSAYVADLAASEGISCRNALLALGCIDAKTQTFNFLDESVEEAVRAAMALGLDEAETVLALVAANAGVTQSVKEPRGILPVSEYLADLLRSMDVNVVRLIQQIDGFPRAALRLLQGLGFSEAYAKAWVEYSFYSAQLKPALVPGSVYAPRSTQPIVSEDVDFAAVHRRNMEERPVEMSDCYAITR